MLFMENVLPKVLPEEVVEEEVGGRVDTDEEVARVDDHLDLQDWDLSRKKEKGFITIIIEVVPISVFLTGRNLDPK
jgi:hypothetical protein